MKNIQIFSKYCIYITLIFIPLLWAGALYFDFFYSYMFGAEVTFISFMYYIAWFSLLFVMLIRPLSELFPKYKILKQLIFLRKAFGILSATIIVCNLAGNIYVQDDFFQDYFYPYRWGLWYPLLARISEITAIILLVTSNIWSMKKLGKNWKRVQRLSYPYFITGGLLGARYESDFYYATMSFVAIIYIVNIINKYLKK